MFYSDVYHVNNKAAVNSDYVSKRGGGIKKGKVGEEGKVSFSLRGEERILYKEVIL